MLCSQVGGFEAYLLADEEEEQSGAAAVYRQVRQDLSCTCTNMPGAGAGRGEGGRVQGAWVRSFAQGTRAA
jgi:hypothetical protein